MRIKKLINDISVESTHRGSLLETAFSSLASSIGTSTVALGGFLAVAIGIAVAVNAVKLYQKHIDELISSAKEASKEFESSTTDLDNYKEKVTELRTQLDSGTLSEEEAYDAKSQLLDIQNQLSDSYGKQAEGIDLVNGSLKEQIGLLDDLSIADANKYLNENREGIKEAEKRMTKEDDRFLGTIYKGTTEESKEQAEALRNILSKYSDNIEIYDSLDGYTSEVHFKGDATEAKSVLNDLMTDFRNAEKEFGEDTIFTAFGNATSKQLSKVNEILGECEDTYIQAQKARMIADEKLFSSLDGTKEQTAAKWLKDYANSIQDYNDALASGDPSKVNEAANAFKLIDDNVQSLLKDDDFSAYSEQFTTAGEQLNQAAIDYANNRNKFIDAVNGNGTDGASKRANIYTSQLKGMNFTDVDFKSAVFTKGNQAGEQAIQGVVTAAKNIGIISDSSEKSIQQLCDLLVELGIIATGTGEDVSNVGENITDSFTRAKESTNEVLESINSVNSILASQSTGASISIDNLSAEGMEDYQSALEYVNGTMQLNAEKVKEITKAKAEEQIAINDTNKALKQSEYLQNAKEIENLRQKIKDNNYATGESASSIQSQIDSLLASNNAIATECGQIDALNASIRESIGVYQAWKDAQNASESGDMFDDALTAMQQIDDVLNNTESDLYGRVGREDYQTALDLVVPENVNKEDVDAVNNYLDSIYSMFTHDENGKRTGLNIENFCEESVEKGLMVFDEASNSYKIAGEKTMEDFADGLGLSLPLVQAMFGEMQEFGGKFNWADESVKTIGDLGVAATEAKEAIKGLEGNENLKINIDVSDIETKEGKIEALDETIKEVDGYKATLSVDSEEYQQANSIIQYCVAQKQLLNEPVVMSVDTSLVDGKIGEAIALLQQFQTAQNELEMQASIGADTTEAQANVDALVQKIQGLDPKVTAELGINDTSSAEAINTALANMKPELLVEAGVNEDAILGYKPDNKEAIVKYGVDCTAVDLFNPPNLNRTVTYKYETTGTPPSTSTGGNHGVNGTAHVSGTAYAGGNWGTATGGKTLVGELGREIVVNPLTGRWYTVGDNGAEFVDVPKNAIVFNHKQSESLLQQGYVAARGTALANGTANLFGTAMVTGGIKKSQAQKSTTNDKSKTSNTSTDTKKNTTAVNNNTKAQNSNTKSQNKNTKASEKQQKAFEEFVNKWQDWIEVDLQRLEEKRDLNTAKAENATGYSKKNNYIESARKNVITLIDDNTAAISKYKSQATKVKDNAIKNKMVTKSEADAIIKQIQNGSINIKDYDEDARSFIDAYTTWYDKTKACEQAVEDLKQEQKELAQTKLDNITEQYDALIEKIEHSANMINLYMEKAELKGQRASRVYYEGLQANAVEERNKLIKERSALLSSLQTAMNNGDFDKNSIEYQTAMNQINSVTESIQEADNNIIKFANDARQVDWDNFDYGQEKISELVDEANFLIDLMVDEKLFDDKGIITDEGSATMALHGQNYNTYMAQADEYADEISKINASLANDPYNQTLIDRKQELIEKQREAIKTAKSEQQAMIDLAKQGYDAQLNSLQKLIDKYKDALNSQKELNDYQKNVTNLAEERDKLQNMVDIYSKIDTEEGRMKYQEYQNKLKDAQEELQETEYEKYISDQENLLDDVYTQAEDFFTDKLENTDALIQELTKATNDKADQIKETLEKQAKSVGTTLSTDLENIWGKTGTAITTYNGTFIDKMTLVQTTIDNILAVVKSQVNNSNSQANVDVKNATTNNSENPQIKGKEPQKTQTTVTNTTNPDKNKTSETTADPILKIINKGNSNKAAIEKDKKKNHSKLWKYIVDKYKHIPTYAIYKELGKALGFKPKKDYKTDADTNGLLKKLKAKGYASGTGSSNLKKDQWVNANEEGQEIITLSDGSILAPMKAGTGIINNPNTEKLYDLANNYERLKEIMDFASIANMSKNTSGIYGLDKQIMNSQLVNGNNGIYHITNDISFNMPNVKNYEEFMNAMMRDPRFEKSLQSMTIGRINGGSRLDKNKFRW